MFASKDALFAKSSGGYQISRSLRFRSSASAYLSRTPSVATNQQKWTWSGWVKRSKLGTYQMLFVAGSGSTNYCNFYFDQTADRLEFFNTNVSANSGYFYTNGISYRDPSAWMHVMLAVDTTAATGSRAKLYVNGSQVNWTVSADMALNYNTWVNSANTHQICRDLSGSSQYFDGYLAEVNFIDGQALTPSSFGAFDTNGVWQPKAYTGTYGTNGFYLPFTDTTGSVGGNDTYAKVLLHGDGANNSTSILDSSWSNRKTFTAAGGAKISTTQSKFGGSSIYFDGANNTAVTCPSNADLNPSGDFTIDCWVYFTSSSSQQAVVIKTDAGGVSPYLIYTSGTSLIYYASSNNSSWDIFSGTSFGTFSLNTWTHIAIVRSGNTYYGFVNGVRTTLGTSSLTPTAQTTTFRLGHYTSTLGVMSGYIDEFRFSNGIARWTADFSSSLPTRYTGYIGADTSGNYNDWDAYNISTSSGTTYDSMIDSPTNYADGGNGRGNYPVANPNAKNTNITISNANLTATSDATTNWRSGGITFGNITSGKWYYEATATTISSTAYVSVGWQSTSADQTSQGNGVGAAASNAFGVLMNTSLRQTKANASIVGSDANTNASGDIIMVAVDFDNSKAWIGKNGTWYDSGNPSTGANPIATVLSGGLSPAYQVYNAAVLNLNFGQRPFTYTPPSGFSALNTQNLPTPTIANGAQYMAATIYAGTSSSNPISNATNNTTGTTFQPDFVWIKNRNYASGTNHVLIDSVRGASLGLASNLTNADFSTTGNFSSINNNGFTVTGTARDYNFLNDTFVGWQWNAGGAPTVNNTAGAGNVPTSGSVKINGANSTSALAGSIAATRISANTSAGFSVVTYTGTGANATVGHGLGVAPSMVIIKTRTASDWYVGHTSVGWSGTGYLILNNTGAAGQYGSLAVWQTTAPSSSVISLGTVSGVNANGGNYVAYCFAPVAGYSAFGSYTGNGSADGPMIFTNMRSRFILIKRTDSTGNWLIWDTTRNSYNLTDLPLYPNLTNIEGAEPTRCLDVLSNGFKLKGTGTDVNASGSTYIYAAFAENPFKTARAR